MGVYTLLLYEKIYKMAITKELKEQFEKAELKERFFMQYYNQSVQWNHNGNSAMLVTGNYIYLTSYLLLRPISSITEKEAKDMVGHLDLFPFKTILHKAKWLSEIMREHADIARSEGFALPFMGISVEEMIKQGWIKLKE